LRRCFLIRSDTATTIPIIKHNPTTIDNVIHSHNNETGDDDSVAILFVVKELSTLDKKLCKQTFVNIERYIMYEIIITVGVVGEDDDDVLADDIDDDDDVIIVVVVVVVVDVVVDDVIVGHVDKSSKEEEHARCDKRRER
jgi:hypothetical protein